MNLSYVAQEGEIQVKIRQNIYIPTLLINGGSKFHSRGTKDKL